MNRRVNVLIISVILLIILSVVIRWTKSFKAEYRENEKSIFKLPVSDVNRIKIYYKGSTIECLYTNNNWFVIYPINMKADSIRIKQILLNLVTAPVFDVVSADEMFIRGLTDEDYGISSSNYVVSVYTFGGKGIDIFIGTNSPAGDMIYVKTSTSPRSILVTSRSAMEPIPKSLYELCDKYILDISVEGITAIEIQRPMYPRTVVFKEKNRWYISDGVGRTFLADGLGVYGILEMLTQIKIDKFLDKFKQKLSYESLGVSTNNYLWLVTINADGFKRAFYVGNELEDEAGKVYLRLRDEDLVCTVSNRINDILKRIDVVHLRDRRIMEVTPEEIEKIEISDTSSRFVLERAEQNNWYLIVPCRARADDNVVNKLLEEFGKLEVINFVPVLATTNLAVLGLNEEAKRVKFFIKKKDKVNEFDCVFSLQIGKKINPDSEIIFGIQDGKSIVFGPSGTVFSLPGYIEKYVNLLYTDFISKTVLNIQESCVSRLIIERLSGLEEIVRLDINSPWNVVKPEKGIVNVAGIKELFSMVSELKAIKIMSTGITNLIEYGLNPPYATFTFDFYKTGDIRQKLFVGYQGAVEKYFVMLSGSDVVYEIDRKTGKKLVEEFHIVLPSVIFEDKR